MAVCRAKMAAFATARSPTETTEHCEVPIGGNFLS